jgi:hypothetical protein
MVGYKLPHPVTASGVGLYSSTVQSIASSPLLFTINDINIGLQLTVFCSGDSPKFKQMAS